VSAAEIPSLRRRPIPGMSPSQITRPDDRQAEQPAHAPTAATGPEATSSSIPPVAPTRPQRRAGSQTASSPAPAVAQGVAERRPASDYAMTRLVNFRLPADLHDRFKQLVREAEQRHPRLRHPSLTELIIGLLEEGPQTAEEVAEVIRRKRAGEHEPGSTG
jgi:hypothetical protein